MQKSPTYARRILVTGGAGFIGSTYLNYAIPRYPEYLFVIVDALTPVADLENLAILGAPNYIFEYADIRNRAALARIYEAHSPTDIIHFAAETHVDASIKTPQTFIETNILGTHHLLALAREYNLQRFQHVSTDEVYGALNTDDAPFTEHSPLAPNNPYSASKAGADVLVLSYHRTFNLDAVLTRCSNNYGPRADATKFIPRAILSLLSGRPIPLYGNGEHIRDWIYVEDHVRAIDRVFHQGTAGEVYNIGGHAERRNIDIAHRLIALANVSEDMIEFVADRPGHDYRYAIATKKMEALGWRPETTFEEGLAQTFAWYKDRYGR